MKSIALATYRIEVRKKNARQGEVLSNFDGEDLLKLLNQFFNGRSSPLNDKDAKTVLKVRNFSQSNRNLSGIIETGEYGFTSDIYDTDTQKVAHKRTETQAGMLPFFFQAYVPLNGNLGVLCLQRFGNYGIRHVLTKHVHNFFASRHPAYGIHLDPVVHPDELKALAEGGALKRITFRTLKIPPDLADNMHVKINPKDAYVEYSIVAKRRSVLSGFHKILASLAGDDNKRPHIVEPKGFEQSRVLFEVKLGGRMRTVDITNLSKIRSYYDITNDVELKKGHPEFSSIKKVSQEVVQEVFRSMTEPK